MTDRTTCACGAVSLPCGCCHAACVCEAHEIQRLDLERSVLIDFFCSLAVAGFGGWLVGVLVFGPPKIF